MKVGLIFPLVPFCALAVNCKVLPSCMEALNAGLREILAGKGEVPAGLCPPQAGRKNNKNKAMPRTFH